MSDFPRTTVPAVISYYRRHRGSEVVPRREGSGRCVERLGNLPACRGFRRTGLDSGVDYLPDICRICMAASLLIPCKHIAVGFGQGASRQKSLFHLPLGCWRPLPFHCTVS